MHIPHSNVGFQTKLNSRSYFECQNIKPKILKLTSDMNSAVNLQYPLHSLDFLYIPVNESNNHHPINVIMNVLFINSEIF